MSKLLRTEVEWFNAGFVVVKGEESLHLDRQGLALWRPDQVESPWETTDEDSEDNEESYDAEVL